MFRNGQGIKCVWKAHNLVDDKLESQKLETLLEQLHLSEKDANAIRKIAPSVLTLRPSLKVVEKRWELSEGMPFREQSVWKILFSFVLCLDDETVEQRAIRRSAMQEWILMLSSFLSRSLQYKVLAGSLHKIEFLDDCDSFSAFETIARAREMTGKEADENIWIKALWKKYKGNMPASSCGTFTCA